MITTLRRRIAPMAVLATGLGSAAIALAPAAHADTNTVTFPYTGTEQTWRVPDGVTSVHVFAVGGHGGQGVTPAFQTFGAGGAGAVTTADLRVAPAQELYVEVGGNGQDTDMAGSAGGFNGGGNAPSAINPDNAGGGGGGGASDVRTVSATDTNTLLFRLLVAGGGGGGGNTETGGASADNGAPGTYHSDPSDAGTCQPQGSGQPGDGGTQLSPGGGGTSLGGTFPSGDGQTGSFGRGGDGGVEDIGGIGGAGGGGGWFGGGGGGAGASCTGAGGGGSSYVDPQDGQNATYDTDTTGTPRITISYLVPLAPLATAEPASGIGQTSATLNGVVNPEGFGTSYHFEWGTSTGYEGTPTAETNVLPTDSDQHAVSAALTGLTPGTQYHFRLVATNANGSTPGDDVVFTTAAATARGRTPVATTSPASGVAWVKAQLNGVVNARGAATTYYFEYGTTTAYGQTTPPQNVGPAWGNHSVLAQLTGLTRHTTYHFRLVATNANGSVQGVDRTFRTG